MQDNTCVRQPFSMVSNPPNAMHQNQTERPFMQYYTTQVKPLQHPTAKAAISPCPIRIQKLSSQILPTRQ